MEPCLSWSWRSSLKRCPSERRSSRRACCRSATNWRKRQAPRARRGWLVFAHFTAALEADYAGGRNYRLYLRGERYSDCDLSGNQSKPNALAADAGLHRRRQQREGGGARRVFSVSHLCAVVDWKIVGISSVIRALMTKLGG